MKRIISKLTVVLLFLVFFISNSSQITYAATANSDSDISVINSASADDDTLIVVSLGDSYSSGEGIPPFYGQKSGILFFDKSLEERANDERWLAHRSTSSWPGRLVFSGMEDGKTLKDYNVEETTSSKVKWYFKAASGAETKHIFKEEQPKPVKKIIE